MDESEAIAAIFIFALGLGIGMPAGCGFENAQHRSFAESSGPCNLLSLDDRCQRIDPLDAPAPHRWSCSWLESADKAQVVWCGPTQSVVIPAKAEPVITSPIKPPTPPDKPSDAPQGVSRPNPPVAPSVIINNHNSHLSAPDGQGD